MDIRQSIVCILLLCLGHSLYADDEVSKHMEQAMPKSVPNLNEDTSICTSHNTLCHISMTFRPVLSNKRLGNSYTNDRQLCECLGNITCPSDHVDPHRSIVKQFRGVGEVIDMRMSYCTLKIPARRCRKNEPVLTLKGNGPFLMETFGDRRCLCNRVLYEHRSWSQDYYSYIEYSCGKPLCHRMPNSIHGKDVCMTVTNERPSESHVPYYRHEYKCRCRYNEECQVFGGLPQRVGDTSKAFCAPRFIRRIPGA